MKVSGNPVFIPKLSLSGNPGLIERGTEKKREPSTPHNNVDDHNNFLSASNSKNEYQTVLSPRCKETLANSAQLTPRNSGNFSKTEKR
jgi:hypothetical protein